MKSHDQSRNGSNLIGTISYHNSSRSYLVIRHLTYLTFRINLPTFGSTFYNNLLNQPFESAYAINLRIELAAPLACSSSLPLINVRT